MCSLFRNKYRIEPVRVNDHDYSFAGAYYITICTKNRIHYFGEIINGEMKLSGIGLWLKNEWLKTPEIRPDMNIKLDKYIIMPNHFHAIIIIGKNQFNDNRKSITHDFDSAMNDRDIATHDRDIATYDRRVAMHGDSTDGNGIKYQNRFGPQTKNLSSIIRGFKSSITVYARKNNLEFAWQPRFYDHIIRSGRDLNRIRKYIIDNPSKWDK